MREENVCLRPLAVEVQIAASSRFLAVVSCFRAASISEQSNGNGNSQKAVEHILILMQCFSYLR